MFRQPAGSDLLTTRVSLIVSCQGCLRSQCVARKNFMLHVYKATFRKLFCMSAPRPFLIFLHPFTDRQACFITLFAAFLQPKNHGLGDGSSMSCYLAHGIFHIKESKASASGFCSCACPCMSGCRTWYDGDPSAPPNTCHATIMLLRFGCLPWPFHFGAAVAGQRHADSCQCDSLGIGSQIRQHFTFACSFRYPTLCWEPMWSTQLWQAGPVA